MPSLAGLFPLPPVQVETHALAAATTYESPRPVAALPDLMLRPRQRIVIGRIYVPVVINTTNAAAASPVVNTTVAVYGRIRGALLWQWQQTLQLTPIPGGAFSVANTNIADDLVNPLALDLEDQLELTVSALYDQAVTDSFFGLGYFQPNYSTPWQPTPGAVYYTSDD